MDLQPAENTNQKLMLGFVVLLAVVIIVGAVKLVGSKDTPLTTSATNTSSPSPASSQTNTNSRQTAVVYKDGTYTADGSYPTPGGTESIRVTLTVAGNTVTKTDISQQSNNRESREYQERFASNYSQSVVGKSLSSINLSRTSGASLTCDGFNTALEQIKSQAQ